MDHALLDMLAYEYNVPIAFIFRPDVSLDRHCSVFEASSLISHERLPWRTVDETK